MRKKISTRRQLANNFLLFGLLLVLGPHLSDAVAQSARQPHLYFFTNDGCAPCRQVEPGIRMLAQEGYPVTTVKLSDHPQWGSRFKVDRTPTVILVSNNRIVGRHAGLIDGRTLKQWFAAVGMNSGAAKESSTQPAAVPRPNSRSSQGLRYNSTYSSDPSPDNLDTDEFSTPTMLQGTTQPGSELEQVALQATVRLKVEDPEGISYATGTVIHSHSGESLVMTCGHVFRDSRGTGRITAEYGFDQGRIQTGPGELISYDSNARDIAVVAIRTNYPIKPVEIARKDLNVARGNDIFSIGCDHGESPTIRRSRIKNRATYDGAIKYDIYGRPVDGRSGGGLFNSRGQLIGVCNAAAVEVDEGIYTALDTIYWQLAKVNLQHLFEPNSAVAANAPIAMPVAGSGARTLTGQPSAQPGIRNAVIASNAGDSRLGRIRPRPSVTGQRNGVSWDRGSQATSENDREVIIIVRSKSNPSRAETITVSDPTTGLLKYLDTMHSQVSGQRRLDVARLRKEFNESR